MMLEASSQEIARNTRRSSRAQKLTASFRYAIIVGGSLRQARKQHAATKHLSQRALFASSFREISRPLQRSRYCKQRLLSYGTHFRTLRPARSRAVTTFRHLGRTVGCQVMSAKSSRCLSMKVHHPVSRHPRADVPGTTSTLAEHGRATV